MDHNFYATSDVINITSDGAESHPMTAHAEIAIRAKRSFPKINLLISDAALKKALEAYPKAEEPQSPLSLPGCLLLHHFPDYFLPRPMLLALESNLVTLWDTIKKPVQLSNKLLNEPQFLNTISELTLARTLRDKGYEVHLEHIFAENRDVDLLARKNGYDYYIDVTNLASRPMASHQTIKGIISQVTVLDLVVEKISTKFRKKFEGPLGRSWVGPAWVAIDIAKNDQEYVNSTLQLLFSRTTWCQELTIILQRECPALNGAIVYRSQATDTHADILAWLQCAV